MFFFFFKSPKKLSPNNSNNNMVRMKISFVWKPKRNLCLLSIRELTLKKKNKKLYALFSKKQHFLLNMKKACSVHMRLTVVLDTLEKLPLQWTVCLDMKPRKTLYLKSLPQIFHIFRIFWGDHLIVFSVHYLSFVYGDSWKKSL